MRTSLLSTAFSRARKAIRDMVTAVKMPHCITLVLDGWSNINMESVWVFIAAIPKVGAVILKTVNGSAASHTGEWLCGNLLPSPCIFSVTQLHVLHCCTSDDLFVQDRFAWC